MGALEAQEVSWVSCRDLSQAPSVSWVPRSPESTSGLLAVTQDPGCLLARTGGLPSAHPANMGAFPASGFRNCSQGPGLQKSAPDSSGTHPQNQSVLSSWAGLNRDSTPRPPPPRPLSSLLDQGTRCSQDEGWGQASTQEAWVSHAGPCLPWVAGNSSKILMFTVIGVSECACR